VSMLRRINCAEANDRAPFFVLGALDAREWIEVREHLGGCRQPHPEYAELGGVVPYLSLAVAPLAPPPELRARVLGAADADVRAHRRDEHAAERLVTSIGRRGDQEEAVAATAPPVVAPVVGPVVAPTDAGTAAIPAVSPVAPVEAVAAQPARSRTTVWAMRLLPLAAVLVIAVLAGWNLLLQGQVSEARDRAAVLRDAFVASQDPAAATAALTGEAGAQDAGGFAVLRPRDEGFIVIHGLAPAPEGSTYEAWYIAADKARPAGLLRVHDDGLAVLRGLETDEPVDRIAVTLEPSVLDQPTGPVLVQGQMLPAGNAEPG
jgi:hypothetical protein